MNSRAAIAILKKDYLLAALRVADGWWRPCGFGRWRLDGNPLSCPRGDLALHGYRERARQSLAVDFVVSV